MYIRNRLCSTPPTSMNREMKNTSKVISTCSNVLSMMIFRDTYISDTMPIAATNQGSQCSV